MIVVDTQPAGIITIDRIEKKKVYRVNNGDEIVVRCAVKVRNNGPANYDNCLMDFILIDQRFSTTIIWEAHLRDGIEIVDAERGLVEVKFPDYVSQSLRRGGYMFSLFCSDKQGDNGYTPVEGYLLVEYMPTSYSRNIPYHAEVQNSTQNTPSM